MTKHNVIDFTGRDTVTDELTALLRKGARQLIQQAVETELSEFMETFKTRQLGDGRAAVVRNGHQPARNIQTGIGPVKVQIPKVRAKDGHPVTFQSALVPPYVRKTRSLEAAIPWLCLKGVSTGEMHDALKMLVGHQAEGLSASTVARLKQQWAAEYKTWRQKDLSTTGWVYMWADVVYSGLLAEVTKLCALVIIGVNVRGEKHFLVIEDCIRKSTQSCREVFLSLKNRVVNTPKLAI